ncbi:MAG: efflux RND transporter periplasmic adaptor subunit, partial [Pirellulales bacterium]
MSAPAVEKESASLARWKHSEQPARGPRRRSNAGRWIVALLGLALIVGLAAVAYATLTSTSGSALASKMITAEVNSSDLLVTVTEDGNLESASNVELKCEVAGGSTILSIVPDGTMVKKGDELVRLDSATIEDNVNAQKILVAKAEAAKITAESTWSAAKIAVQEYLEGIFVQEKQTLEANTKVAEENLRSAQNTLAFSDRMLRKGYVTQLQRDSHAFAVERAKLDLANAQTALNVLEKYTKEKMLEDLTSARDSAEAQMNSELATFDMESAKLTRLETQMKKCILIAPQDGMVVYANDDAGWGQQAPKVELGAAVKEYQSIIRLPDLSTMQVKVLVHESKIDAIRRGLRARIKIQDRVLQGTVTTVASQPEQTSRWMGNIKEYATLVKIDGEPEGLKPGMTADVTILVDQRKDVLNIPVQCVVERGRKFYAWVRNPGGEIERRELVLGATNDTNIEIKDGLNAGDRVLQNPRSQLAEAREGAAVDEPVDVQKTFGEAAAAGGP